MKFYIEENEMQAITHDLTHGQGRKDTPLPPSCASGALDGGRGILF